MQRWRRTCGIEVAGPKGIEGTDEFLRFATAEALARGATLHWGQRNTASVHDVETSCTRLDEWREVLAWLTNNGRLSTFSTKFSRDHGLEVVQPRCGPFDVEPRELARPGDVTVTWNAFDNPRGTDLQIEVVHHNNHTIVGLDELAGSTEVNLRWTGAHKLRLVATYTFAGETRRAESTWIDVYVDPGLSPPRPRH